MARSWMSEVCFVLCINDVEASADVEESAGGSERGPGFACEVLPEASICIYSDHDVTGALSRT